MLQAIDWPLLNEVYDFRLDSELMDILHICSRSTKAFAAIMLAEHFDAEFTPIHDEIFEALDNESIKKIVIAAPRGIGKTTIAMAYMGRRILYLMKHFIIRVSNSSTVAELETDNLKMALLGTPIIRKIFGSIKTAHITNSEVSDINRFSTKAWVANGTTLVLPRGNLQQIRGLKYKNWRPDDVFFDDLEDTETIGNEDVRKKRKIWFDGDAKYVFSSYRKDGRMIYIDTLKHEDSLLADLKERPDWKVIWLSGCDENFKSLAPSWKSDEEIAELVSEHREQGTMDVFYREIMNAPIGESDSTFSRKYFKYYNESQIVSKDLINFVIVDYAKTTNFRSAESAVFCAAIDPVDNAIYFRGLEAGKWEPDETESRTFAMIRRFKATHLFPEVTGLNQYVVFPLKNAASRMGIIVDIQEVNAPSKLRKPDRPRWLIPLYKAGLIHHNDDGSMIPLEKQELGYPFNKRWDCLDCAAYVPYVLEKGGIYMLIRATRPMPAIPGLGEEEEENFDPFFEEKESEKQYADIVYEKPLKSWRRW